MSNNNHFIIGLGGTGGKIIRSFKKALYQEFRDQKAESVNLAYLYVDSSDELMKVDEASWKILGTSVQLDKRSQLLIQEADLNSRLTSIDNYPGIKPWIGDKEQWREILGSIVGVVLGGQKRRLGRFLFACKADKYKEQVQSLVKNLQETGTTDVTFHVVCGLAGGTGSGSVVDAVAMLRDSYPDAKRYRILIYALLPETYPHPSWDTGNYHANGFAALLELNALSVGAFSPTDLLGRKGRLNVQDPFTGCYLFTNENENGLTVDVDKRIPEIVADFLYQKIIAAEGISWGALGRWENAENGDGSAERSSGSNHPERSKRFLTFGIKRLAVPEQEITEYLTYSFARQTALQMRFNTWSDSSGFLDESRAQDLHELVHQKENLFRWGISDDHLTLSTGILPEDAANKKWKPIEREWQDILPNFKVIVREKDRASWLDELSKLCEKRFDQDYRGVGVRSFYTTKLKARREHAREVRRRIETELFEDWRNGVRSLTDLSSLLDALIEFTSERRQAADEKTTQTKDGLEGASNRVRVNNEAWARMGPLDKIIGRPDSLLDAQAEALQEKYILQTRIEAIQFSKQLMDDVIGELTDLKSQIDQATSTTAEAARRYNNRLAERLSDNGRVDMREQLVRFYEPVVVRRVISNLVKDESQQRTQTASVRKAVIARLGESPTFAKFNQGTSVDTLIDVLDKECRLTAQTAHNNLIVNDKEKLFGVSIIDRLKERYGSDTQALKTYVTELVGHAGSYLTFNPSEMQKSGPGISSGTLTAVSTTSVIMPKRPELADFVKRLKDAFYGARVGVEVIDSDNKPNEIAIITLIDLFPVRYVRQASFLKEKYDERVRGSDGPRARMELHLEGDGTQFPRIFVPLQEEMKKDALPYLLIARALGLVRDETNPQTGTKSLLFVAQDEAGFDTDPIELGKNLVEALARITLEVADVIHGFVDKALAKEISQESQRSDLQTKIVADVNQVKVLRGGSVTDEVYRQFLEGGKLAIKIIRPEN